MPNHPKTVTLEAFLGLNNKQTPERMGENFLAEAYNIDIDHKGKVSMRPGFSKMLSGTKCHSLWSDGDKLAYYVKEGSLYKIDPHVYTQEELIATGLNDDRYSFLKVENKIYYGNTRDNGVIDNGVARTWGIPAPSLSPILSTINGTLPRGRYEGALRYRTPDGRVSGAGGRFTTTLATDNEGVRLFGLQGQVGYITDIYLTTANGELPYYVGSVPFGITTFDIDNLHGKVVPIDYQYTNMPLPGELIQLYRGRLYSVRDNVLWYTEPHAYEHSKPTNFIQFQDSITNVMPVDDGIFVTADALYFLDGRDPETFDVRYREKYKGAKYTGVKIVGGDVILENIPTGVKWLFTSDKGIIMVGTGGMVFNLTEKTVMVDGAELGTAIFKSKDGLNQYVSILKDPNGDRVKFGDSVAADVVRNGIVI
jgi:hypothetical protein